MRKFFKYPACLVGVLFVAVAGHLALIEIGREVVVLKTPGVDGGYSRRLWVVDYDGAVWVHSGGHDWLEVFRDEVDVELMRAGSTQRFHATPVPGPHPAIHDALREKYGIADRWVRFLGPDNETVVAVRLDPVKEIDSKQVTIPAR